MGKKKIVIVGGFCLYLLSWSIFSEEIIKLNPPTPLYPIQNISGQCLDQVKSLALSKITNAQNATMQEYYRLVKGEKIVSVQIKDWSEVKFLVRFGISGECDLRFISSNEVYEK